MRLTPEIKRDNHAFGATRRRRCAPMAPMDALPPAGLPDARDLPRAGGQAPIACRAAPGPPASSPRRRDPRRHAIADGGPRGQLDDPVGPGGGGLVRLARLLPAHAAE